MKIFCEACQRIGAAGGWSVIDGELRLRCDACGAEAPIVTARAGANLFVGSPAPSSDRAAGRTADPVGAGAAAAVASADDGGIDHVLADFVSMPTPGPRAAQAPRLAASFAARETDAALAVATSEPAIDDEPWLEIGWAQLVQQWSDPAAHRRLLAEAAARGDFAGLGARYREHLQRRPDDAVALAAREELLQKATAQLFTRLPQELGGIAPAQARTLRNAMLGIFLLGLLAFAGWVALQVGVSR